jgi:dienelactone hydrolase
VSFEYLGPFSDLVSAAEKQAPLWPEPRAGATLRQRIRDVLGFVRLPAAPREVRVERTWTRDGLCGEEVSWWVGYGTRTHAFVLRPEGAKSPLPAVLALHSHDGVKFFGKDKIADGPDPPAPEIVQLRDKAYGGRAFANVLARRGFVVLAHDVLLWGSRRFSLETMHARVDPALSEVDQYNAAAREHEHLVAKYCSVLGTTLAGLVSYDDRAALAYLRARSDVLPERIGCIGLSGGGCRAALLQATSDDLAASAIVGMMSTFRELLDAHLHQHTWMFVPPGLARVADWPDLAAAQAPAPLLVQYNRQDPLFSQAGMEEADVRIARHYRRAGQPEKYAGQFYDGPHKFDVTMQESAFDWLAEALAS